MITINAGANFGALHRTISALGAKQVPFATALALNRLASGVAGAEREEIGKTFDNPTPFTQNAFYIRSATKTRHVAYVMAKDIQAEYLEPYLDGDLRYLGGKRGMIVPMNVALNQYGNLPRNKLRSLKGKPNTFIGPVKTKSGKIINGVWQRPVTLPQVKGRRVKQAVPNSGLKLLIKFADTTPAPKRLHFVERARDYVRRNAHAEFKASLRQAVARARR